MAGATKKGKQCPGGYWIPRDKKCGKSGKAGGKGSGLKAPKMSGAAKAALGITAATALGGAALYGASRLSESRKEKGPTEGEAVGKKIRDQANKEAEERRKPEEERKREAEERRRKADEISEKWEELARKEAAATVKAEKAADPLERYVGKMMAREETERAIDKDRGKPRRKDSRAVFDACEGIREKARLDAIFRAERP